MAVADARTLARTMTSKTGSTAQTLEGTVTPPTIAQALFGAIVQLGVVGWAWSRFTTFGTCFASLEACSRDPWARQVLVTLGLCACFWLYSLRTIPATGTSDPSIVDRLWSVLPWCYVWHLYASSPSPRLLVMALVTTVWGVRLTYNFAIKGGFSGGEDYRWAEIRTWPGFRGRGWELFNMLFICFFQQLAILAFTSPAAAAAQSDAPLNGLDVAAAALYLLLVAGEALADHQQYVFQTEKYRRIGAKVSRMLSCSRSCSCASLRSCACVCVCVLVRMR